MIAASVLDPQSLIESLGAWALLAVLVIVFAECGLLIGFFLPGDSLLFTAGLLVASGFIQTPIEVVCLLIVLAAFAGNLVGYWIGKRFGAPLFQRPDSRFFRQEYVDTTRKFFDKYGGRAVILARFVPIVRTFITAMAGIAGMRFRTFAVYSAVGALLWGVGVTMLGYFLGQVPFVANHIELILIGMVAISVIPVALEWRRSRKSA